MINLMPPDVKLAIKYAARNVSMIQYIILVLIIGLAMGGVITFGVQVVRSDEANLNRAIAQKQEQLDSYSESNDQAAELSSKIKTIKTLLEREVRLSEIIQEIGSLMPPGSSLSSLQLTDDLSVPVLLTASVQTKPMATELQQNLANSDLFIGADIQSINVGETTDSGAILNYNVIILVAFPEAETVVDSSSPSNEELLEALEQDGGGQ